MFKQELIELKGDGFRVIKAANTKTSERDVQLIQDLQANITGKSCVIIQNQSVNFDVTDNVIGMIQKIDDLIERIDGGLSAGDTIECLEGALNTILAALWEKGGISIRDVGKEISHKYLRFGLRECNGNFQAVAKHTGDNRTTLREFNKRMIERNDAREKELRLTE